MSKGSMMTMAQRLSAIATVLLVPCLGYGAPAKAAEPISHAEQSLIRAEDQRFHAQVANDVTTVDAGLADDLIYTHATGRIQTKAEILAGMTGKGPGPHAIEAYDRTVHVIGATGIVHGLRRTSFADRVLVDSYLAVYARRRGHWRLLAWQTSPPPLDPPR